MSEAENTAFDEALTAALEPIVDAIVQTQKAVAAINLERGESGAPGAGIEAPAHVAGKVYREGAIVTAYIGQYFKALQDTAEAPGVSDHWGRIGGAGFRLMGAYDEAKSYQEGDLFMRDFGCFLVTGGEEKLLVGRGAKGERGHPGEPGKRGRDGGRITAVERKGFKALLIQEFNGETETITLDFGPAFEEHFGRLKLLSQNLETRLLDLESVYNRLLTLEKSLKKLRQEGALNANY